MSDLSELNPASADLDCTYQRDAVDLLLFGGECAECLIPLCVYGLLRLPQFRVGGRPLALRLGELGRLRNTDRNLRSLGVELLQLVVQLPALGVEFGLRRIDLVERLLLLGIELVLGLLHQGVAPGLLALGLHTVLNAFDRSRHKIVVTGREGILILGIIEPEHDRAVHLRVGGGDGCAIGLDEGALNAVRSRVERVVVGH